jgi:NAD+ kinase
MANKTFKHIVLMGRPGVQGVPETLQALVDYLTELKTNIAIEEDSASILKKTNAPIINIEAIDDHFDLMIVVGGDGSLLNAAHCALQHQIPVLGINRGRLGFLTDIHPDELHKVGEVLSGDYQLEQRFLLDAEIHYLKEVINHNIALNDVVLLPGDLAQMIEFETHINNQFVCKQRADGLIVSSPTGSTAYALSGGGPILHPKLDAVVLVPMFPHTLSSRPIVVDANSDIDILVSDSNDTSPYVSCDGQTRVAIPPGGRLKIHKKRNLLQLIHPNDYNYFTTLREKLGWEKHAARN